MKRSSKGTKRYSGNFFPLLCFLGLPASLPEGKCCYQTLGIRSRATRCTCTPGRRHAHIHNTRSPAHTFSQTHNRHTPTLPLTPADALTHTQAHFYTRQALTPTHPPHSHAPLRMHTHMPIGFPHKHAPAPWHTPSHTHTLGYPCPPTRALAHYTL